MKEQHKYEEIRLIYYDKPSNKALKVIDAQSAFKLIITHWKHLSSEQVFKVLLLDRNYQLIAICSLRNGGIRKITDHPALLLSTNPSHQSQYVILAHNNLFEDMSDDIRELIQSILQAARVMELTLLDHLVVLDKKNYVSGNRYHRYDAISSGQEAIPAHIDIHSNQSRAGEAHPGIRWSKGFFMN